MVTNTLKKFCSCPEQPKKTFSFQNIRKKKTKRNKSGLHPALYSELTEEEKQKVNIAMVAHNEIYGDQAYFEPEQFYQEIYRHILRHTQLRGAANV